MSDTWYPNRRRRASIPVTKALGNDEDAARRHAQSEPGQRVQDGKPVNKESKKTGRTFAAAVIMPTRGCSSQPLG